jgi:uncharacterized membrane protein
MNNKPGFNTAAILIVLIVLLVVLNIIGFIIYKGGHPDEDITLQRWNYLESSIFKIITVSLIFPIILFVLERRFKIAETVKLKRQEERSEKRWECIEQTIENWNQLWDLISEVIYFRKDNKKDKGIEIEDLLIRLRNFVYSAWGIVNMWTNRFPELPDEYYNSLAIFLDTEINSAQTVAWYIGHSNNAEGILEMQNSLERVVESINYLTYHDFVNVLKQSKQLLELRESNVSSREQEEIDSNIKRSVAYLKDWADAIQTEEDKQNTPYSFANTVEAKAFQDAYQKLRKWKLDNPQKDPSKEYREYDDFERLFYKVPHEQVGPYFSREFVIYLANWIGIEYELATMEDDEEGL